jgi:hypothetical protein
MKTTTKYLAAIGSFVALLFFMACNKENSSHGNAVIPTGQSKVSVHLMDDPIQFSKVLIDIRQVAVLVDTSTAQTDPDDNHQWDDNWCGRGRHENNKSVVWDTLSITQGVYDLLQLRNGTDTLLGSGLYVSGKILKVRVTLGSDNSVYTDSTTSYPLEVFGPHPYFDINVRRENVASVTNNQFELWLDFNLSRSIFFWSGTFLLKPYITIFNDVISAKVKGQVLPGGASALVTAIDGTDTLYAVPGWNGSYMFRGVPAGTYSINFKGRDGYQDTTITGISVDSMRITTVPTITLHK